MTNSYSVWICLLAVFWSASSSGAEELFDFNTTKNVPYVPSKLEQSVNHQQTLDIYRPKGDKLVPVILYLHGGGWAFGDKKDVNVKPYFFTFSEFAFVSMNYRLRWDYKVYDQLVDVVSAIKWIVEMGAEHGLDGSRVVLMGHAAGAHLASLVMADSSYLEAAGMDHGNVKAVVAIDSVSYDIPRLMRELGSFVERRQHQLIFGGDESVWEAASPITHVASSTTLPPVALLYNPESDASLLQAKGFAREMTDANITVVMIPGSQEKPAKTDELLGTANNVATGAMMAFIRSQL